MHLLVNFLLCPDSDHLPLAKKRQQIKKKYFRLLGTNQHADELDQHLYRPIQKSRWKVSDFGTLFFKRILLHFAQPDNV